MKAAHSRFLPDILPAKTIVVRRKRKGKPSLLRTCLNARAKHNISQSTERKFRQIAAPLNKAGNGQKQSLRTTTDGLIAQLSDLSLLLAELNNFAMRGRAF